MRVLNDDQILMYNHVSILTCCSALQCRTVSFVCITALFWLTAHAVGKHGRHVMAEFLCVVFSKLKVKDSFIYTHGHVNSSTVPT